MTWPRKKLGEVLEYEQPTKYLVNSTDYRDEYAIPVLTAGKSFLLGNTNEKNGIFPKEKLPVIIFDDFTTAIKFVDFPFKVKSSAMKILHARKGEADIRFMFYKMLTIEFSHNQHKRYWISECSKIEIPLPPLAIQKQIVERLDKIVDAQKLNDDLIQKSGEFFQSLLHSLIRANSGIVKKLGEIVEVKGGKRIPKGMNFSSGKTSHPYLRVTDFVSNSIERDGLKYIDENVFQHIKRYVISSKDIYISIAGTIGLVGKIPSELEGANLTENAAKLLVNGKKVNQDFLIFCLSTNNAKSQIRIFTQAVGVPKLALERIEKIKIPIPPLKIQKQIVEKLSAVQEYKNRLLDQKVKLKELFESVLHKSLQNE